MYMYSVIYDENVLCKAEGFSTEEEAKTAAKKMIKEYIACWKRDGDHEKETESDFEINVEKIEKV